MALDPKVWGPHYWFVLHTIARTYPTNPTETAKKKYYDLVQNMPVFLPVQSMGDAFSACLDEFPVTPYLDSRSSLVKWMHFIHNRINREMGEDEIPFDVANTEYYAHYVPKAVCSAEQRARREKTIFCVFVLFSLTAIGYLHFK